MSNKRETYNSEPFGTPRKRAKRTFLGALFVIVLLAVTISFTVALVIAYLTPYVAPSTFGSLTIVGIFAPILFAAVAVCMLLWLVTGRWKTALIVFIFLIPGLFRISDFYNIAFMREVETKPSRSDFTLMTYNVRGFYGDDGEYSTVAVADYLNGINNLDVVCFQEFDTAAMGVERIDSLMQERKLAYKHDVTEYGNVVLRSYSRFPIIASGDIAGDNRGASQWFDVILSRGAERKVDTLRIFNNHLHSMNIPTADSDDITDGDILQDGDRMRSIVDRIASNSSIRVDHVDTLDMVIKATPYEHIICGDFNDTPMSFVYGRLVENHRDAFVEVGSGYGYTFRPMYGTLRIDYVLHSKGIDALKYVADPEAEFSDHLPVIVTLKREK
ncbi:MAG: endonuclease/exonuclease/phosphatase family protein [Alistipes sp.]|nr:endonuclease/exonuclease/phosphatase family protein [Alistipes sp.]